MGKTGGSCGDGAKSELVFVLLVILTFIVTCRLRETGMFDRPAAAPFPPHISKQAMLKLVYGAAAIQDRTERLRRIDAVVAEYGDDKTPHIDYGVTWILAVRAASERTDADKLRAYDVILRRHSSHEGLPARTAALLDRVGVRRAALLGDTEALKKAAEENAGGSRPEERSARMLALNELGKAAADADAGRRYFDLALAECREGDYDEVVLAQAGVALSNKAMLAKGEERKALLRELIRLAQSFPVRYARADILLRAGVSFALEAEPEERLRLLEEIIGRHKNDATEYVRGQLQNVVWRILTQARERPDREEIFDRLAAELRGSASENLTSQIFTERAKMLAGDAAKRFFSELIAGAGSNGELFSALKAKLSNRGDRELVREAAEEVIACFADTRNAEYARLVVSALDRLNARWPFGREIRLYNSLIDRFADAESETGLDAYMSALLGKAKLVYDTTAKAALCDRILATPIPAGSWVLEIIRKNAAELKSGVLYEPEILARYYAERIAAGPSSDQETARLLLSQAKAEPLRAKKEALFDRVIADYGERPGLEKAVVDAFNGRAEAAADREEVRRRFRETVEYVTGSQNPKQISGLLSEAYGELFRLARGKPEEIALRDEQIQLYLEYGEKSEAAQAMMSKAVLVNVPEKIVLYDRIMELLAGDKDVDESRLLNALLAKAEAVEDDKEKNALYDRVIEAASAPPASYGSRMRLARAIEGKSKLPGGAQYLEEYLDMVLRRENDLPANIDLATELVERIGDKEVRDAGYEKIRRRYSRESSTEVIKALDGTRISRASSSNDFDEVRRLLMERSGEEEENSALKAIRERIAARPKIRDQEARKDELNRRFAGEATEAGRLALLDEFIDRAAARYETDEAVRLLFLKADTASGADAKAGAYEEILDRTIGWRSRMHFTFRPWRQAAKVVEARAALMKNPAERMKYYDSMIAQYGDAEHVGGGFLPLLYTGRTALIADPAERKSAIEHAIGELEKRGVSEYDLRPLHRALTELNAEL